MMRTQEQIIPLIFLLFVSIGIVAYCEVKMRNSSTNEPTPFAETPNDKIFSWLSEQSGFFVHPSFIRRGLGGDFMVKEGAEEIQESEILMVIPSSAIVSADDNEDEEVKDGDPICALFHALSNEFQLNEESKYAPYIKQLTRHHKNPYYMPLAHASMTMPSTWSFPGRRLLTMINNGSPQDDIVKVLEEYQHCLIDTEEDYDLQDRSLHSDNDHDNSEDSGKDEGRLLKEPPPFIRLPADNRALELTEIQRLQKRILEKTIQHQIDGKFLVPLYDQIAHHHYDYNVVHQPKGDDAGAMYVVATRSLKPGDRLTRPSQTCLKDCNPPPAGQHPSSTQSLLGALKLFGQVQRYPHVWEFRIGLAFVYHHPGADRNDATNKTVLSSSKQEKRPSIEWIRVPTEDWQLDLMESEVSRQAGLYESEIVRSNETVPTFEWIQAEKYSHSIRSALSLAVSEGRKLLERRSKGAGASDTKGAIPSVKEMDDSDSEDCDPLKDCSLDQIYDLRGCSASRMPSAMRNDTEWHLMRASYVNALGQKATIQATHGSGFRRPYRVAHSPGRGRGVFATEDIPKGALLWTTEYTAWFEEGDQFRRFLAPLSDDVVCDLMLWCYTCAFPNNDSSTDGLDGGDADEKPTGKDMIGCDLDAGESHKLHCLATVHYSISLSVVKIFLHILGSLMNSYDNIAEYNAGTIDVRGMDSELTSSIYATRDIAAGEELVTAYDEFDTNNYTSFGL